MFTLTFIRHNGEYAGYSQTFQSIKLAVKQARKLRDSRDYRYGRFMIETNDMRLPVAV